MILKKICTYLRAKKSVHWGPSLTASLWPTLHFGNWWHKMFPRLITTCAQKKYVAWVIIYHSELPLKLWFWSNYSSTSHDGLHLLLWKYSWSTNCKISSCFMLGYLGWVGSHVISTWPCRIVSPVEIAGLLSQLDWIGSVEVAANRLLRSTMCWLTYF